MAEILTLGIVASGLLLMLGILKAKAAINILFVIILVGMLLPFAASFGKGVDSWILLVGVIIFGLLVLQGLTALFFGRRAADSVVASLIASILLAPFRFVIGFLRSLFFRRSL